MEDVTISRADADGIHLLDAALRMLAADLGDDYVADKSTLAQAVGGEAQGSFAFLATRDGVALGAVLASPVFSTTRGGAGLFVSDLWVEASARGQGLSRRLLSTALREGARRGFGVFIKLSVYHDNPDARAAYQRLGFAALNGETNMVLAADALENLRESR